MIVGVFLFVCFVLFLVDVSQFQPPHCLLGKSLKQFPVEKWLVVLCVRECVLLGRP